ncbi:MAG: hypothetical protein DCF15_11485 [Phormidesmis priestleyi]|uniref:SIMPL domain-containing protein n=1 Tax=Phormidesmis priestleyi TaxID=268141 RepID=A0A2W4XC58_9CYAN|nr:MAG: hypothetical protein DCF15_11485 [Phormidesmis priestleyi]
MLNFRLVETVLVCAIATTSAIIVPKAAQAAALAPAFDSLANELANAPTYELPNELASERSLQLAQFAPLSARQLSVTGNGTASTPADKAAIILSYVLNYYPEAPSTPNTPPPLPPTIKEADLQPVRDALIAAGVSASDISFAPEAYNTQSLRMIIRINRPTRERINTLIDVASAVSAKDNRFFFSPGGVVFSVQGCEAAAATARQAAMTNAREQATALASTANVQFGDILAVSGSTTWRATSPYASVCPTSLDDSIRNVSLYGSQPYDPSQPTEVFVESSISVSYEIQ